MIETPGHTADSVCLLLPADGAVLTGDTVLGRGTTVIAGDGSLADYLRSLDRLRALADEARPAGAAARARPAARPTRGDAGLLHRAPARSGSPRSRPRSRPGTGPWPSIVARVYAGRGPRAVAVRRVVGAGPARLPGRARAGCPPGDVELAGPAYRARLAQPLRVDQQHRLGMQLDPAAGHEVGQRLVDRLPGRPDQLGQFLLGQVVVDLQAALLLGRRTAPPGRAGPWRPGPGTSVNTRSAMTSLVRRSRWASAAQQVHGHVGPPGEPGRAGRRGPGRPAGRR